MNVSGLRLPKSCERKRRLDVSNADNRAPVMTTTAIRNPVDNASKVIATCKTELINPALPS